jgi:hypothetical protein
MEKPCGTRYLFDPLKGSSMMFNVWLFERDKLIDKSKAKKKENATWEIKTMMEIKDEAGHDNDCGWS